MKRFSFLVISLIFFVAFNVTVNAQSENAPENPQNVTEQQDKVSRQVNGETQQDFSETHAVFNKQMNKMRKERIEGIMGRVSNSFNKIVLPKLTSPRMRAPIMQNISNERVQAGRAVFLDTGLGTNGKSCSTCHSENGNKPLRGKETGADFLVATQYCYNNFLSGKGIIPKDKLRAIKDYFIYYQQ